jgi:hypothetical protein
MLVEARLGDAHIGRHLVDGHHVEALLGQQPVDRRDDCVLAGTQHLFLERDPSHAGIVGLAGTTPTYGSKTNRLVCNKTIKLIY